MSGEVYENQYVSYPMFKGIQKPLEFMGFQGRYITWAACAVGGAILGFIIVFSVNLCFLMLSFWGFLILLFLICFFRHLVTSFSIGYQYVTSNQ